jgi:hypothetical protein
MSLQKYLIQAMVSAVLSSIACLLYNSIYSNAFDVNFSAVLNITGIIGSSLFGCLLMGFAYYLGTRWKGEKLIGWINILIAVLSFASIVGVLGFQLPVSMDSPELFPGLAIPMHFFPALSFFSVAPFFITKSAN